MLFRKYDTCSVLKLFSDISLSTSNAKLGKKKNQYIEKVGNTVKMTYCSNILSP